MPDEIYAINNAANNVVQPTTWSTPSWDLFIFVFFFAVVLVMVVSFNRERLFLILIGTYLTAAIIYLVPFFNLIFLKNTPIFLWRILLLFFILLVVIRLFSRIYLAKEARVLEKIWQIVWFSVLETGLLFCLIFLVLPAQILNYFSALTAAVFTGDIARSIWALLPILSLIFVKKR